MVYQLGHAFYKLGDMVVHCDPFMDNIEDAKYIVERNRHISMIMSKPDHMKASSEDKTININGADIYKDLVDVQDAMHEGLWGNVGYFFGLAGKEVLRTEQSFYQLEEIDKHWCGPLIEPHSTVIYGHGN